MQVKRQISLGRAHGELQLAVTRTQGMDKVMRNSIGALMLSIVAVNAQTGNAAKFEVASVKLSEPAAQELTQVGPDNVYMRHVRLTECIRWAYDVRDYQLTGPEWLNDVWVDIQAKAAMKVKEGELR